MSISLPRLRRQTDSETLQTWTRERIVYWYPARVRRLVAAVSVGILTVSTIEYLLTWVRAVSHWLGISLAGSPLQPFSPQDDILHALLLSHVALACAILAARAIAFLTPKFRVVGDELVAESIFGARQIRFRDLERLVSMEIKSSGRFIVWIETRRGLPLQNWLAMLLFGRWFGRGFLITSDVAGFDTVMGRIVEELQAKYGSAFSKRFAEIQPTYFMHMLLAPQATVNELARAESIDLDLKDAALQMASAALAFAVPLALAEIVHFELPWRALFFLPIAFGEWPLASVYLASTPIGDARQMRFDEALRVYPFTQLPRWIGAAGVTLLVVAGAPSALILVSLIAVVALDCYWVLRLVKEWFVIGTPEGLMGVVATAIFQIALFEFSFLLIPW